MAALFGSSSGARRETRSERRDRDARLTSARRAASTARLMHELEQEGEERSRRSWRNYSN
jgi:hypothetical protein